MGIGNDLNELHTEGKAFERSAEMVKICYVFVGLLFAFIGQLMCSPTRVFEMTNKHWTCNHRDGRLVSLAGHLQTASCQRREARYWVVPWLLVLALLVSPQRHGDCTICLGSCYFSSDDLRSRGSKLLLALQILMVVSCAVSCRLFMLGVGSFVGFV